MDLTTSIMTEGGDNGDSFSKSMPWPASGTTVENDCQFTIGPRSPRLAATREVLGTLPRLQHRDWCVP